MIVRRAALVLGGLLAACGGKDEPPMSTPTTAQVTLRFAVPNGTRRSPNLVNSLRGPVYGAIFKSAEVTIGGPIAGAQSLESVEIAEVDLQTADTSTASWTSKPLPADTYIFLGFYDVDGNGEQSRDPDSGDPVTLPSSEYRFPLEAGKDIDRIVSFDLIFN